MPHTCNDNLDMWTDDLPTSAMLISQHQRLKPDPSHWWLCLGRGVTTTKRHTLF